MNAVMLSIGWGGLGYVLGCLVRSFDSKWNQKNIDQPYLFSQPFAFLFPIRRKP